MIGITGTQLEQWIFLQNFNHDLMHLLRSGWRTSWRIAVLTVDHINDFPRYILTCMDLNKILKAVWLKPVVSYWSYVFHCHIACILFIFVRVVWYRELIYSFHQVCLEKGSLYTCLDEDTIAKPINTAFISGMCQCHSRHRHTQWLINTIQLVSINPQGCIFIKQKER